MFVMMFLAKYLVFWNLMWILYKILKIYNIFVSFKKSLLELIKIMDSNIF